MRNRLLDMRNRLAKTSVAQHLDGLYVCRGVCVPPCINQQQYQPLVSVPQFAGLGRLYTQRLHPLFGRLYMTKRKQECHIINGLEYTANNKRQTKK